MIKLLFATDPSLFPERAEFLREVLDAIDDGVYAVSPDGRILSWNRGAERITGYTAEDVVGRSCGDNILNHIDADGNRICGSLCPLLATRVSGASQDTQRLFCLHKLGHRIPVWVRASPVYDDAGTLLGSVEIFRDDSEAAALRARCEELAQQAHTDALTGLPNRRRFDEALDVALYRLTRYGRAFGLALFDLDRFKDVNDVHGHEVGDAVLRMVALTIANTLRKGDVAARWGGEEFAVLLPEVDHADLLFQVTDRIRGIVANAQLEVDHARLVQTVSAGVTLARIDDDGPSLLRRVDTALYVSKHSGRNRVTLA